jgi:hypothetical protein
VGAGLSLHLHKELTGLGQIDGASPYFHAQKRECTELPIQSVNQLTDVGCENLVLLGRTSSIFWDIPPCSLLKIKWSFGLVSCLPYSSTLKIKAICSSETSVDSQRSTWRYIPQCRTLHLTAQYEHNLNLFVTRHELRTGFSPRLRSHWRRNGPEIIRWETRIVVGRKVAGLIPDYVIGLFQST